jgi:PAS domain S-box-containing protein
MINRVSGNSIRLYLAILSLVAALPALGVVWHMGEQRMRAATGRAMEQTAVVSAAMAAAMDSVAGRARATAGAVAALPELAARDKAALTGFFDSLRKRNPELVNIAALTPEGEVIAASRDQSREAIGELRHVQDSLTRGALTAGMCPFSSGTQAGALSFALPVSGSGAQPAAVVVVAIALPDWAVSQEWLGALPGMELGIINHDGVRLLRLPRTPDAPEGGRVSQALMEAVSGPGGPGRLVTRGDGQHWFLSHRQVRDGGGEPLMTVLAGVPETLALGPARKALYGNAAVMLALAAVSVCLALVIGEYTITRPLKKIGRAAGRIAGGDFHARADTMGAPAEISSLGTGFDAMAAEIERRDAKRRRVVMALRSNRQRFKDVVRAVSDWVWEMNPEGEFTYVSSRVRDLLGFSPRTLMGKPFHGFLTGGDAERFQAILPVLVRDKAPIRDLELWCRRENGGCVCMEVNGLPLTSPDGALLGYRGVCVDVTGQKQAEEQLLRSLGEKEVLLREVHHRVKNNLQIISSLMSLETQNRGDIPEVERAFEQMRGRVRSIALIHERLYKSDNFSAVEMAGYIESLCASIKDAHNGDGRRIMLGIEAEPLAVPLDRAIPMGLLLNEAITNAFKHAFNGLPGGRVNVRLTDTGGSMALEVIDDGVGLPEGVLAGEVSGLGMQILHALSGQIGGELAFPETKRGTAVLVTFPRMAPSSRRVE